MQVEGWQTEDGRRRSTGDGITTLSGMGDGSGPSEWVTHSRKEKLIRGWPAAPCVLRLPAPEDQILRQGEADLLPTSVLLRARRQFYLPLLASSADQMARITSLVANSQSSAPTATTAPSSSTTIWSARPQSRPPV